MSPKIVKRCRRTGPTLLAGALVVLVPLALMLAVLGYWRANGFYPLIGDEPHLLLIADSLAHDGDLWVENNYAQDNAVSREMGAQLSAQDEGHVIGGISISGAGLPLLLAAPYALGGVVGAKLALTLMIGLTLPLVVLATIRSIVGQPGWSVALTLGFVCALPFLAGANQIYTDLVAGIVILHGTYLALVAIRQGRLGSLSVLALGTEIALLPWLYYRYLPPALILLVALMWQARAIARDRGSRYALAAAGLLIGGAFVGFAAFNSMAFGNLLGMFRANTVTASGETAAMVLLGLHLDSWQGMFTQQPLLWLALIGIVLFVRVLPRGAMIVGAVYGSATLPEALHTNWYGGMSFAGRYGWVEICLWVIPLAYAAALLIKTRVGRWTLVAALGVGVIWQAALAGVWLRENRFLYNEGFGQPIWATADWYTAVLSLGLRGQYLMPAFRNVELWLRHPSNYLALAGVFLLILSGGFLAGWRRGRRLLLAGYAAIAVAGLWLALRPTPSPEALVFDGAQLPSMVGTRRGTLLEATPGNGGFLAYGPYIKVWPGRVYRVQLDYLSGNRPAGIYDVALNYGQTIVLTGRLAPPIQGEGQLGLTFRVPGTGTGAARIMELRVYYAGRRPLSIQRLSIQPVAQ